MCEKLLQNESLELFCFASRWNFWSFSLQDFWWTHYSFQAGQSLGDRCYSLSRTAPLLVLRPTLSPGRSITEWSMLQPFPNNCLSQKGLSNIVFYLLSQVLLIFRWFSGIIQPLPDEKYSHQLHWNNLSTGDQFERLLPMVMVWIIPFEALLTGAPLEQWIQFPRLIKSHWNHIEKFLYCLLAFADSQVIFRNNSAIT